MYAIFAYDTEDIYYPPEYRIDDIPGWLGEIMSEVGVTGTFFVMGEKAEKLLERDRRDVLEKMAPHDIASHQQGNRYPLLPQVVEAKSWQDGVEAVRAYEDWVTEQHLRAFGKKPVGFSRHNCYFAPHHIAVAAERGLPYMYTPTQIPGSQQPLWYAGAVTFPTEGPNTFGSFDRIFSRDEIFAQQLRALDEFVEQRLAAGNEWVTVFGCHPVQVMARDWLEHHTLGSGRSRTPQELGWHYRAKPREEEDRAKANFRKLCTYLREHPDLEVVGIEQAGSLFATQPPRIGRDALIAYSRKLVDAQEIAFHPTFSPAELLCGLADSLIHDDRHGDLPEEVTRRDVLGPAARPAVAPEKNIVAHAELVSVCQQFIAQVETDGHLPANVSSGDGRLGLGQIALLAARSYLAQARYDRYDQLSVTTAPRYPQVAYSLDAWIRRNIGDHWAMPLDFSCDALAEHARLQTWTMKPAWLHSPQGPVASRPYAGRVPFGS